MAEVLRRQLVINQGTCSRTGEVVRNCGCGGHTRDTGGDMIGNAWSDAARQAALEARQASAGARAAHMKAAAEQPRSNQPRMQNEARRTEKLSDKTQGMENESDAAAAHDHAAAMHGRSSSNLRSDIRMGALKDTPANRAAVKAHDDAHDAHRRAADAIRRGGTTANVVYDADDDLDDNEDQDFDQEEMTRLRSATNCNRRTPQRRRVERVVNIAPVPLGLPVLNHASGEVEYHGVIPPVLPRPRRQVDPRPRAGAVSTPLTVPTSRQVLTANAREDVDGTTGGMSPRLARHLARNAKAEGSNADTFEGGEPSTSRQYRQPPPRGRASQADEYLDDGRGVWVDDDAEEADRRLQQAKAGGYDYTTGKGPLPLTSEGAGHTVDGVMSARQRGNWRTTGYQGEGPY
jgi:hypothetical protein